MNEIGELRNRIEQSDAGPAREYVQTFLADSTLDHVLRADGEPLSHVILFVEGRLMSSARTGHKLPGAQELISALRALPSDQLLDRFAVWTPDAVCIACFRSGSADLLGVMISYREPGRPSFTSKGSLPQWLQ